MSITIYNADNLQLNFTKKYNNLQDIKSKYNLQLKSNGYLDCYIYDGVLYNINFDSLYNTTKSGVTVQNNQYVFLNGYIDTNKAINFIDQFSIFCQFKLNNYQDQSILFMNDNEKTGFRCSINKIGYYGFLLFEIYYQNQLIQMPCQLTEIYPVFNSIVIQQINNTIYLYFNKNLILQKKISKNISNSSSNLILGGYKKSSVFKTLNGTFNKFIISKKSLPIQQILNY